MNFCTSLPPVPENFWYFWRWTSEIKTQKFSDSNSDWGELKWAAVLPISDTGCLMKYSKSKILILGRDDNSSWNLWGLGENICWFNKTSYVGGFPEQSRLKSSKLERTITNDRMLAYQQKAAKLKIAVVIISKFDYSKWFWGAGELLVLRCLYSQPQGYDFLIIAEMPFQY